MNSSLKGSTPGLIEANYYSNASTRSSSTSIVSDSCDPEKQTELFRTSTIPRPCTVAQTYGPDVVGKPEEYEQLPAAGSPLAPVPSHDAEGNIYPEGGLQAWLVVLGSFCGMLVVFGLMNTIGVFHAYLAANQLKGFNESTIGWIFSIYTFLSFFCGIQIGPIFDAKGPRLLIFSGSVLVVTSMLLLGLCTKYWHFILTFGLMAGLGTALVFTPAVAAIGHFFLLKRGFATGLAAGGGSVGGVIFPLMLQRLLPLVGFAWTTRILAFIYVLLFAVAVGLIRSRLPPKTGASVMPDLKIFRDLSFASATAAVFFMEWALFVPLAFITSFAASTSSEEGSSLAYTVIAVLNAGSCIGRWVPGLIADKLGRFNCMTVALFLCTLTTMALWLPASLLPPAPAHSATIKALAIVYAVLFGMTSGSNISLTPVCIGQLCDTQEYGRFYATCYTIVSFGTLTGIPLAGALIRLCGGRYYGLVLFTGLSYVCSTVAMALSRWLKVGLNPRIKF